jgi:hypothetical protein
MTTLISAAIMLLSLAGSSGDAVNSYGSRPTSLPVQTRIEPGANTDTLLRVLREAGRGENSSDRILRSVFVVPGPDLAPEGVARVSEDLAIMCRIFDKAAVWAYRAAPGEIGNVMPVDVSSVEVPQDWIATQALYLDGYGAIFFLPVDFPLAAAPQEQTASKTEPSGDPLWSQTADELRGVPQESGASSSPSYDAQKVENLKTALIATLRHAANVQTRRTEDVINVVVASRTKQANVGVMLGRFYGSESGTMMSGGATAASELPSVLILRTTKSDVDALAKGSLSQEQFAGKVQILKSWTTANVEPLPAGAARSRRVVPSLNRW